MVITLTERMASPGGVSRLRRNEESVAPIVIVGRVMASGPTFFCARSNAANISVLNLLGGGAGMEIETSPLRKRSFVPITALPLPQRR
jgi:hypothetical protein